MWMSKAAAASAAKESAATDKAAVAAAVETDDDDVVIVHVFIYGSHSLYCLGFRFFPGRRHWSIQRLPIIC